jgi:hypothetical protein
MIYFVYFVFKWVQRIKVFKWCSNFSFKWFIHLNCEKFQQKVLSPKAYSKEFFFSSSFIKKFQKFTKSLLNWIQISTPSHFPCLYCRQGISVPRMALHTRSYRSINLPVFLFGLLHLPKCSSSRVKVTPSYEA